MYQQSKPMLIFLIVVFLATTIATGVMTAIVTSPISGGKLYLCITSPERTNSWTKTSGVDPFRNPYMSVCRRPISDPRDMDTHHCMGDPCFISRSLDYYKALS